MITPEYILSLVNFNLDNEDWKYKPEGNDMFCLQAQGSSRIYNILEENKIALLADEVGMGKTIQALSVCAAMWKSNPQARILVLAPRDEIVLNWEKEYLNFIFRHYRLHDDIVKARAGSAPVKKMIRCGNLFELVKEIKANWGNLFIGKISSFSNLMSKEAIVERVKELGIKNLGNLRKLSSERGDKLNREIARLLKNEITEHAPKKKPYFDLVIIDEAHYFRNRNGDSLRVQTATEIFGRPDDPFQYQPLAEKVLLLTATPNHSSSRDIVSILEYFTTRFSGLEINNILEKICVRRLRRLGKKCFNKYRYRLEIPSESNFKDNPLGEMFFALYQHELAKQMKEVGKNSGGRGNSRMMKYLEGVEFIPFNDKGFEEEDFQSDESAGLSTDYSTGTDANILHKLSDEFMKIFNRLPIHPKYEKIVEDLTVKHNGEKAVVFVRRIPSVFEIAQRILDFYDRRFWIQIQHDEYASLGYEKLNQKSFTRFSKFVNYESEDYVENDLKSTEDKSKVPASKVLDLFRTPGTNTFNFRKRFNPSAPSIFALFFSPAEDYFSQAYRNLISFQFEVGDNGLPKYYYSALIHRTNKIIDKPEVAIEIQSIIGIKQPEYGNQVNDSFCIPTFFSIFWEVFLEDEKLEKGYRNNISTIYKGFTYYEKEAFSSFIEKGALLASEAIIWFYETNRKIISIKEDSSIDKYLNFCHHVKSGLKDQKLYIQIQESIMHFKIIYSKVFSINGNDELLREKWDYFSSSVPIYTYNADNSSKKVLGCFNTPFYPDMLVATSVLQEGVNLQYFCNTVYHYGMAWTPGDNEQRIGRIDRMFGKIERLLDNAVSDATLNIYHPYLKDTVDENQLRRFVKRKFRSETLIDKGMHTEAKDENNEDENENENWKEFLRKPEETEKSDPFPVQLTTFSNIPQRRESIKENDNLNEFYYSVMNAIKGINTIDTKCYFVNQAENKKILLDPVINGNRKQPVIVDLLIDHIGTGAMKQTLYCLRMKTPLGEFKRINDIKRIFHESDRIQKLYLPGIKLCADPSNKSNNWGIYMSSELPLILSDTIDNPLSQDEIQKAFLNLIYCADQTEKEIFNSRDLTKEELSLSVTKAGDKPSVQFRFHTSSYNDITWEQRDGFFILEDKKPIISNLESGKTAFIYNHENLYIKAFLMGNHLCYQISYPTKDAQKIELEILKKHWSINKRTNPV